MIERLVALEPGQAIVVGGDRVVRVGPELAAAFSPGDRLLVVDATGDLLHVPLADGRIASAAVGAAVAAFDALRGVDDAAVTAFFEAFAARLADDEVFAPIAAANAADVADARARGRSTTRLVLDAKMRAGMVAGLRVWRDLPSTRGRVIETVEHAGWRVEQSTAGLGVVGFVFEGRPNVFADACGVLRGGNTVVFRIGSDALGTARAIVAGALEPALRAAGVPVGAVRLVDSASRASGWALFSDRRLALAVARGSGDAVAQLGAVARQAGVPVSLHGTGGAWLVAGAAADPARLATAVRHSLDRKVCNTLNVCCVPVARAAELVPLFCAALEQAAAARGVSPKLHVGPGAAPYLPAGWLGVATTVRRADGEHREARAEPIAEAELGREWEWEDCPEVTLVVVADTDAAVALCNRHSPRLVACIVTDDLAEEDRFVAAVDTPFVGNGFTRWVDGQFALGRPELGLSNWETGRLLARSAVLSGDSVFTVRTRARQFDPDLHR
jgi:glutamate-5-semialdehyde dehydrogenase